MKLKTRKSVLKRIKKTKNSLKHKKAFKGHLLRKKSSKRLRSLSTKNLFNVIEVSRIYKMLPYV